MRVAATEHSKIYQQLGKMGKLKSTEQEEKFVPQYDNKTRDPTPVWKSRHEVVYARDVAWTFWFWSEF